MDFFLGIPTAKNRTFSPVHGGIISSSLARTSAVYDIQVLQLGFDLPVCLSMTLCLSFLCGPATQLEEILNIIQQKMLDNTYTIDYNK